MATGVGHSVEYLVKRAYAYIGKPVQVETDPEQIRPLEVDALIGDSSKAERILGWRAKTTFDELLAEMMEYELGSR